MATINTFNITPADISAQVHNLSITPSSSPTTTQVEEYITYAAAEIASEAQASGIGVSGLEETDSAYMLLKKAVINKVTADILVARNRGDVNAGAYYMENYRSAIDTLRRMPQRVQDDANDGPDLAHYIEQGDDDVKDIAFYNSIPGRIVLGGL